MQKNIFPMSKDNTDKYLDEILELQEKFNAARDDFSRSELMLKISDLYRKIDKKKSIKNYLKAVEYIDENEYPQKKAEVLKTIGLVYIDLGEIVKSIEYLKKSVQILEKLNKAKEIADIYNTLGTTYNRIRDLDKALDYYLKSIRIFQDLQDYSSIVGININIGYVFSSLHNFDKSKKYLERSLEMSKKFNNQKAEVCSLVGLGITYVEQKKYNHGLEYFQNALSLANQMKDYRMQISILNNIGVSYEKIKQYRKSLRFYEKALVIALESSIQLSIARITINIGSVYLKQNDFLNAKTNLEKGIKIAEEIQADNILQNGYRFLSQLYHDYQHHQKSLEYLEKFRVINERLCSKQRNQKIAELQAKHQLDKVEKESLIYQIRHHKLIEANQKLKSILDDINKLKGLLPVCASCHKVRNDQGYWQKLEDYIEKHSKAHFINSYCPDCKAKYLKSVKAGKN